MTDLQERMGRLVDRLLEGGVVPFLGAGVSNEARCPSHTAFVPTVAYLKSSLQRRMRAYIVAQPRPGDLEVRMVVWLTVLSPEPPSLTWLAELGAPVWGHEEVCKELEIEKFAALEPLAAHRYLAFLAREGLIGEVITTNYDCCIERAFRESFGSETPVKPPLSVITNLSEYRAMGRGLFPGDRPVLRLYKIGSSGHLWVVPSL